MKPESASVTKAWGIERFASGVACCRATLERFFSGRDISPSADQVAKLCVDFALPGNRHSSTVRAQARARLARSLIRGVALDQAVVRVLAWAHAATSADLPPSA